MLTSDSAKQFFIDTSYLVALFNKTDAHYERAMQIASDLPMPESDSVFLSDVVINETANVMTRRGRQNQADVPALLRQLRQILPKYPILCLYETLKENYGKILTLMAEKEGRLSFHDSLIALFLKEVPDVKLVSFDEEFKNLGWLDVLS